MFTRVLILAALLCLAQRSLAADPPAASQPGKPKWLVPISKETTRVLGPLKEDGSVDYAAALDKILSEGVTPENNAAVPLAEILGIEHIPEKHRASYARLLGLKAIPEKPMLSPWSDYAKKLRDEQQLPTDYDEYEALHYCCSRRWTAKQFPEIATWLKEDAPALDRAVESSNRQRFWAPCSYSPEVAFTTSALEMLDVKNVYRALAARALLRLSEGDHELGRMDLAALLRWGKHFAQQPLLIHNLIGYVARGTFHKAAQQYAEHTNIGPGDMKTWRSVIDADPSPNLAVAFDVGERFYILEGVQDMIRLGTMPRVDRSDDNAWLFHKTVLEKVPVARIEWGDVFRRENDLLDKMIVAFREPNAAKQQQLCEAIEKSYQPARDRIAAGKTTWEDLEKELEPEKALTEYASDVVVDLFLPAYTQMRNAPIRVEVERDLCLTAFALSAYKAKHGEYPDSLKSLVPELLASVPRDPFGDGPVTYRRTDSGFLLYSFGQDRMDDEGKPDPDNPEIELDTVVRVPSYPSAK